MFYPVLTLAIHHLLSRPLRTVLTVFGVGIGVSAAMAMFLANEQVFRSFEQTVTSVVGKTTIQVTATEGLLDEQVMIPIRTHQAVESVSPIITIFTKVLLPSREVQPLRIQAVDLLEWLGVGTLNFSSNSSSAGTTDTFLEYLIAPDVLFFHQETAKQFNFEVG
ncbi:MAG: ABC transporter permease, partial [Nitrospinae bacterium]|nr:ABC transporter permease [Nitrospinota bacterium]